MSWLGFLCVCVWCVVCGVCVCVCVSLCVCVCLCVGRTRVRISRLRVAGRVFCKGSPPFFGVVWSTSPKLALFSCLVFSFGVACFAFAGWGGLCWGGGLGGAGPAGVVLVWAGVVSGCGGVRLGVVGGGWLFGGLGGWCGFWVWVAALRLCVQCEGRSEIPCNLRKFQLFALIPGKKEENDKGRKKRKTGK